MMQLDGRDLVSRRHWLGAAVAGACASRLPVAVAQTKPVQAETYATHAKGIRIFPGAWRPHYPWEHIAWVSPSWPSQDYIWLDFPEAIFTEQGLLYLSHVNPRVQPVLFPNPPAVPWRNVPGGIAFERVLPNKVAFGGKITQARNAVDLELFIRNGSATPLTRITLQTCCFLRAIREFAGYTAENKYVHVPDRGWLPFDQARQVQRERGRYRLGWRSGRKLCDLPIMVTVSAEAKRLIACTWNADTYSLINNPRHPCMHADPAVPDLAPGAAATIRGKLAFFEGSLDDFDATLRAGRLDLGGSG